MKKEFDCKPICDKKFLKTKSYGDESIDFHDKVVPKVGSNYACLAVIIIYFVLKIEARNYFQVFFFKKIRGYIYYW